VVIEEASEGKAEEEKSAYEDIGTGNIYKDKWKCVPLL